MKKQFGLSLLSATCLAGVAWAAPAHAQGTDDSASSNDGMIVVTGRLRGDESVQDVPLAVTVVSTEQLATQGALTVEDVEGLSPNLVIDPVGAGPGGVLSRCAA